MSTTQHEPASSEPQISGWAAGGITFAATMAVLIGTFQIVEGLVAVINDEFFVVARNYTFDLDVSAWGWIHLIIGLVMVVVGFGLFVAVDVGRRGRDRGRDAERRLELLLHPVLPDLGAGRDRAQRLDHLVAHAPWRDQDLNLSAHPTIRRRGKVLRRTWGRLGR